MRKLLVAALSLAMTGTLLTGCMKMEEGLKINSDGSCSVSTTVNIEKDILLDAYAEMLNEMEGGAGYTQEDVASLLEQTGMKPVKIDGKEYYDVSSQMSGDTSDTNFNSITEYYRYLVEAGGSAALSKSEDNTFSVSETSAVFRIPANYNILDEVFGEGLLGSDELEDLYGDDESGNEILDMFGDMEAVKESLKGATVTYNITFPEKVKEVSSNVTVSKDGKSITATFPVLTEKAINEYAYCENDIAAEGALSGVIYNKAVSVSIPENVSASLNGKAVSGNSIKCDKTGTYNIIMTDEAGNKETLCFMVDTTAPSVYRQKDVNLLDFDDIYAGDSAIIGKANIAVYDIESDIEDIKIDGNSVCDDAVMNFNTNEDKDSLISMYFIYSYDANALDEGSHTLSVIDSSGNETEVELVVDRTKPVVKGVKNNKTYKKSVTVKFSDKNGIKSAKLNGKTIKSGQKVSKKGSYTLKVTDNADNVRTVKFKVKKG